MCAIGVGVKEADGDAFVAPCGNRLDNRRHRGIVQWQQHLAGGVYAFAHDKTISARNEGRRQDDVQIVLLETVFRAHFQHITKTFGRHEGRSRTTPLDQRVGGERRAVDQKVDRGERDAGHVGNGNDPLQDGPLGCGIVGQHLGRMDDAIEIKGDIREGTADIDTHPAIPRRIACHFTPQKDTPGGVRARNRHQPD